MKQDTVRTTVAVRPDPRLAQSLAGALFLGLVAMLSLPSARGDSAWFGLMPLWLLGMPLAGLLALHLRSRADAPRLAAVRNARRGRGIADSQGRRRGAVPQRTRLPRVA